MTTPAPVVFREVPGRWMLGMVGITVLTFLLIRGLFMAAAVASAASLTFGDYVEAVVVSVVAPVAAGLGGWAVRRRHPGWVSLSAEGLEFAAARHRATFLPWAGVAAVRRRRSGPFTQLLVTPARPEAVFHAQTPGRSPRLRGDAFVVDVGMMKPGPAAMLAELNSRRHTLV